MIDFTPWTQMLQTHVQHGKVDYGRWQTESAEALARWLADAKGVDLELLESESAIAFLINLYNALVVQQVLQRYPIDSIRPTVLGIPNWIGFLLFFKKPVCTLGDRSLSLDGIEHGTLRSRYSESRIHFALVCAAEGCPLLRAEAYTPAQLSTQLEADVQRFINNPAKVRYDAASNTLYCSKIFKWYESDFLAESGSIPAYIQRYLPDTALPANVNVVYLPYSWRLNDQRISS